MSVQAFEWFLFGCCVAGALVILWAVLPKRRGCLVVIRNAPAGLQIERRKNDGGGVDVIVKLKEQIKTEMEREINSGGGRLGSISSRSGKSGLDHLMRRLK